MARVDDYINAKKIACDTLKTQSFSEIAERSGFVEIEPGVVKIPFLNRNYRFNLSECEFTDEDDPQNEIPLQEQVLLLHYMQSGAPEKTGGQWIAYREIPGASFYFSAFVKRAIDPLKKVFGLNIEGLVKSAAFLGGKKISAGDAGFHFDVLPNAPIQLILWEADDEFAAEANILFDETIGAVLSPEDVAWLAGMLVYRLIALSKV